MPTYAYACQQCGHTFEIRQSFSDDTLTACPECTGQLRKLFNNVGVVFKGSGFYRNDSRSSSGSGESSNPKESSGKESSPKESSKPAGSSGSSGSSPSTTSSSTSGSPGPSGSGSSRSAAGGSSSAA